MISNELGAIVDERTYTYDPNSNILATKDLIRKRQRQVFEHGKVLLQIQGVGLLSVAAACRADPL